MKPTCIQYGRIGSKIVAGKKAMLERESKEGTASHDRDLFTPLIKSNLAEAGDGNQSMSD
jgi:hypothetical protein